TGLYDYALSLWPAPWNRYVGYFVRKSLELFSRTWGLKPVPGHDWRTRIVPGQSLDVSKEIILCYKEFET
ncbi:MAG: hypothetical protein RBT63_07540, partial [Bdellovibrionales bacterium]|nr:hypothetical protein [Bdellovibrionales bacterium]